MEVMSKAKGTFSVDNSQIYTVPHGLFGFEDFHEFAMIEAEQKPFVWFQCTQSKDLAFLMIDPFLFCKDYELDIDDECLNSIGIASPSDVMIMTIVTVPSDGGRVTANLQGPVIFNKTNHQCIQIISSDPRWYTKHDILSEMQRSGTC